MVLLNLWIAYMHHRINVFLLLLSLSLPLSLPIMLAIALSLSLSTVISSLLSLSVSLQLPIKSPLLFMRCNRFSRSLSFPLSLSRVRCYLCGVTVYLSLFPSLYLSRIRCYLCGAVDLDCVMARHHWSLVGNHRPMISSMRAVPDDKAIMSHIGSISNARWLDIDSMSIRGLYIYLCRRLTVSRTGIMVLLTIEPYYWWLMSRPKYS